MPKLDLRDIAWTSNTPKKALEIPDHADNFYLKIISNLIEEREALKAKLAEKDEKEI